METVLLALAQLGALTETLRSSISSGAKVEILAIPRDNAEPLPVVIVTTDAALDASARAFLVRHRIYSTGAPKWENTVKRHTVEDHQGFLLGVSIVVRVRLATDTVEVVATEERVSA